MQLEFEPFTDASAHVCHGRFYTQALSKALKQRLQDFYSRVGVVHASGAWTWS